MQRMLVQLKLSLFMIVTVTDVITCIIQTWLLSRFVISLHAHMYGTYIETIPIFQVSPA